MGRPVIYASTLTRRQARMRRVRRRSFLLGPRVAMLALWVSVSAFAVAVVEHLA